MRRLGGVENSEGTGAQAESHAVSRTRFLVPHTFSVLLFAFPSAGAVDKIVFPEGMQTVNFYNCTGLTGTRLS